MSTVAAPDYEVLVRDGLSPQASQPATVIVVGAGIAGLVATDALARAGHCGAFALFAPGQEMLLHPHIIAPEGRIHFAGEHASLTHRWIQGSIESGLRAASEVHTAARAG